MTRKQISSGLAVDLTAPDLSRIDIETDIAGPLSRMVRFAGHRREGAGGAPPPIYTVAQHCVVGADALLDETGDATAALAFLVHDAHEALIGDIPTPAVAAIEHWAEVAMRVAGGREFAAAVRSALGRGVVRAGLDGLKRTIDAEIHRLAGLPHPLPAPIARVVAEMDVRMLDLERRMILGSPRGITVADLWGAVARARPVRVVGALTPWTQTRARAAWMSRWRLWRTVESDGRRKGTSTP